MLPPAPTTDHLHQIMMQKVASPDVRNLIVIDTLLIALISLG